MNPDDPLPLEIQEKEVDWEYLEGEEGRNNAIRWKTFPGGSSADLTPANSPTKAITMGICEVPPGARLDPHCHTQHEVYYVQHGSGDILLGEKIITVKPGSCIYVPGNLAHGIKNQGSSTLSLLWIFPTDTWSEVEYHMQPDKNF